MPTNLNNNTEQKIMNMTKEKWLAHIDIDTKLTAVKLLRSTCSLNRVLVDFVVQDAIQREGWHNSTKLTIEADAKAAYITFNGKRVSRKKIAELYTPLNS
jgi:hypothetical protein